MLILLIICSAILAALSLFAMFLRWASKEHTVANQYRELVRQAARQPAPKADQQASLGWTVIYRDGTDSKTISVAGATEAEALKNVLKRGIKPHRITMLAKS